jgi:hypothetical protein
MIKEQERSWHSRVSDALGSFTTWLKKSLKRKGGRKPIDEEATKKPGLDEDSSFSDYVRAIDELDDVIVKLGVHKRIAASQEYMYEMGRRDGALGVTLDNLLNIARANALELFRHIYVIIRGQLGTLKAEFEVAKNIQEHDETLYKREKAYYDYAKYQYRFFPRSHSLFLFALYLVLAVALIVADIPLALRLIQKGFDLESPGDSELQFPNLFLGNFRQILFANWETVFTAVGIALCTIYIKIYYDEFVGTPYANRLMTFKRFLSENGFTAKEDEKSVLKEHRMKGVLKTVLFFITILSIVALSLFRLQTAAKDHFEVTFFSGAAFVAITLLFPLIGGICLSHSLNNSQNLIRLWFAKYDSKWRRRQWIRSVAKFTIVERRYYDLVAADEKLISDGLFVEDYKDYLVAFYERGYAIGGMQPDKYAGGEDFFNKILEWRSVAVSRKINVHIGLSNQNHKKIKP